MSLVTVMRDTIGAVIDQWASSPHSGRPAIVGADFAPVSYRELALKITAVGEWLRASGLGASSRVGIVLPRGPEAALLGVSIAAHAITLPLNPALSETELEAQLVRAKLDAVVLPEWTSSNAWAPAHAHRLGICHASRGTDSLSGIRLTWVCRPSRQDPAPQPASFRSVSILQSSSGTTGTTKLILITHANLLALADKVRHGLGVTLDDRCAFMLPLHSGFGFKVALIAPLLTGGSVVITKSERAEAVDDWASELHPTWFVAVPTFLHAVVDRVQSRGSLHHSMRFLVATTAYLSEPVRSGLEAALGVPVLEYYGLGEAGVVAANPRPPSMRKPGSAGLISPDMIAIQGPDGASLPVGDVGEVLVRGQGVSPGYVEDLPVGCDTVPGTEGFRGEWFATGDLGFVDRDGFLMIVGRTKEIVNRGGEKISPYEVEKVLLLHPSVREAGAFAVPHPRLGENLAAAVALRAGTTASSAHLRDFLAARLPPSKVPQHVFVTDDLPKGATGKISRPRLSERFATHASEAAPAEDLLQLQMIAIWQRLIGRRDIGIDENFFEAGGDSLLAAQMLAEVESAIQLPMARSNLKESYTIRQLAATVREALPLNDALITRLKHGTKTPLFYCHADDYNPGFYAVTLAELLEPDQPVFLLHPYRRFDIHADITMEALARAYVPQLLTLHPRGPFRLAGFCLGGMLAWEIAHQLAAAGREIEFVAMIDGVSVNARLVMRTGVKTLRWITRPVPEPLRTRIILNVIEGTWQGLETIGALDGPVLPWLANKISRALDRVTRPAPSSDPPTVNYWRILMNTYLPPAAPSPLYCLVCDESQGKFKYSPAPWHRLARRVHVKPVPGGHLSCISAHLDDLAKALTRILRSG